jgi:hypothetical protein
MTGSFLSAWVLFPLLMLALSAGSGLLVWRLSGRALSGTLVLPVGFALTLAICTLGTSVTWLAPASGALAAATSGVGFLLGLSRLRPLTRRRPSIAVYAGAAAVSAFAVYAAPVVLTGTPSWTGFGRIVDTAFQMAFAQHLADVGRQVPVADSSFNLTVQGLAANGYPGGAQATLGALAGLIRTDVAWCYQPYLAFTAAMGALSLFALLRRVVPSLLLCCIGASIAIQANILYDYALEGGIKELTTAALIALAAAILVERVTSERRSVRSGLALAPAIAAAAAAFSYGVAPWLGLLLLAGFGISLVPGGRLLTLTGWLVAVVATAVLAIPTVISSIKLFGTAKEAVSGVVEVGLGNLTRPIPEISTVGVWISNDYRFPMNARTGVSHAFDIGIIVLATLGVIAALWRRRWMNAAIGIVAPIALTYVVAHSGPWVELKAYTITSTLIVAMAFVGAGWLITSRAKRMQPLMRAAGWLSALAVTGSVLYGNALTYHDQSLAPAARYEQLAQIGKRFSGEGPAFFPAFDEYSEYFLRREHGYDLVRPPGLKVRPGAVNLAPGQFAYSYDLNQLELGFLEGFPLLIVSRTPFASRAPANYDLAEKTSHFEVFRRTRPASDVFLHLPLSGLPSERTPAYCRAFENDVRRAGRAASVAYVPSGTHVAIIPTQATHPSYWHPLGPESLRAYGAGEIKGSVSLPSGGTYDISMPGSIGREVTLYVDGRRVGSLVNQWRYPGQFLRFSLTRLSAGRHRVRLVRPNGNLLPGSGDGPDAASGVLGPIIFTLEQPEGGRVVVVPGSMAARACAARVGYEWMEVLRPGARSASS